MIDYTTEYAQAIVDGKIIAGKKTIQACARHLKNLTDSKDSDYPYFFDVKKANRVIEFIEMLPNPDDGKPLKLVNFQKFIVGSLFGWKNKETGFRRFKKAVISMGRKQGKSLVVSGIALYMLLYEEIPKYDRQIYCAANTRQQAKVVYNMIVNFLKQLRSKSKIIKKATSVLKSEIRQDGSGSYIMPLSSDYNSLDGLNVLLGIIDEQSRSTDYGLVDVLETSQGQQSQALLMIISTVSEKVNAWFCTQEYPYVTDILSGKITNESYFCVWYEQDNEAEIADEANWIKSNPILFDEKVKEKLLPNIRAKWQEATDKDNQPPALIKYFNMWQQESSESYIKIKDWKDTEIEIEPDLMNKDVYIGMDLARVGDLSAVSWIVPLEDENKFFIDSHAFVGTRGGLQNKIDRDKIPYDRLANKGLVTLSEAETGNIDDQQIIDFVYQLVDKYQFNVKNICFDRYSANNIINNLVEDFEMVDVAQGYATLSEPTKQFRKYVQDRNIIHTSNQLLEIAVNNAVLKQTNDAVMIDKAMYRNKIDPLAAGMDAWTRAVLHDFKHSNIADNDFYINEFTF
ncbi:terminase large subunit [Latilactobacillus curvatus]|uniref:Terminase large subunit n=1 Tax=Latilactobacillus curvatus TaxID=28038 RepID=A0A385ACP7_LATCU|nr:terminase TerL endonuclease subunit [Latilactobacillus curvatus]AXN35442.1 terminase large subunit [Latilactobacillus curvatus]